MTDPAADRESSTALGQKTQTKNGKSIKRHRRRITIAIVTSVCFAGVCLSWIAWLASTAMHIKSELETAANLVAALKTDIASPDKEKAVATAERIGSHTLTAKDAVNQPFWTLAATVPYLGANFSAVSELARSADDVVNLGLNPLVEVHGSLEWDRLLPSSTGIDLEPLEAASPAVNAASNAVTMSAERLNQIDATKLLPQVAEPLRSTREQLQEVTGALKTAADASRIAPPMLGSKAPRNYLLMIQNNAEARASGGIPGALAVLTVDKGKFSLTDQSSAGDVGIMSPAISLDVAQQKIYSGRLGKFMQDVNLTPDFPTAASTAQAMWERKTGYRLDGVLSIDPVALSYVLEATGPVKLQEHGSSAIEGLDLPNELSSQNVVETLLSEVYAKIEQPALQDVYFASVAKKVFEALASGSGNPQALITSITRGGEEGRVLMWSAAANEQSVLADYRVSGSVTGPSVSPAQFGVYFNDGTGAKMDYYVKRTVQLIKECPEDGYEQTTVRVTSTNTAPVDAAASLPAYVTGGGNFGVPPGSVQTNIVAYGPVQAQVETAKLDGQKTEFAPYFHSHRPVGILAIRLAPGDSRTVDFTFGKIVQHTEPNVVVTPTVQDVKDVTLPTEIAACS